MADDGSGMDLNLYLGLPSSLFGLRGGDLGSDLTLSPLLPLSPSSVEQIRSQPILQANRSPSNALSIPESLPMDPLRSAAAAAAADGSASEHGPLLPSVEPETNASDAPNSPPYAHALASQIPPQQNEAAAGAAAATTSPYLTVGMSELAAQDDRSPSRPELLDCPEFRFQRLIQSSNRMRVRRFRSSSGTFGGERPDSQTTPDTMRSQRTLESSKKDILHAQGKVMEDSEKEKREDESAANFECNICFEMAREPVVTPCGHLFCWPCLYKWLHAHSVYSECPVCKGEVLEVNVTPIYGRGGSDTTANMVSGSEGGSELKIPPRPLAHRTESLRQQVQRPISRRVREESAASWRHIIDEEARNVVTLEEYRGLTPWFTFGGAHRALITRLRRLRVQREEGSGSNAVGIDLPVNTEPNHQLDSTGSLFRDGTNLSRQSPFQNASAGRLRARLLGRPAGGRASPSADTHSPEPLYQRSTVQPTTEQASASSTMAMILGDVTAADISAEPSREGSSRSLRRRGRSSTSGSLDVDGGALHARRRRRLN